MSETKDASFDSTKRLLKNIFYRYMEYNGFKYIHKMTPFVTTMISRTNCLIDWIPKNMLLFFLYGKLLQKVRKTKLKIGDTVWISDFCLPLRNGYRPEFTQKIFGIVATSSRITPTYTIKDEQDEIIHCKFYQKMLNKVIYQWNR